MLNYVVFPEAERFDFFFQKLQGVFPLAETLKSKLKERYVKAEAKRQEEEVGGAIMSGIYLLHYTRTPVSLI